MKNIRNQEILPWIDQLKGIGILAVIAGHMATPLSRFIYSWHIPLFFFASGLLMNRSRTIAVSVRRDFSKLIIPFFTFSFFGLAFEYFKRWLLPNYPFVNGEINLAKEIIGIFWWMDYSHLHHYGFVLWFLPALFWSKNINWLLIKVFKNKYLVSTISLGILILISFGSLQLPLGIKGGLMGLFWLSLYWLLSGKFWLLCLFTILLLPLPITNIAVGQVGWYGVIYSLLAINVVVGIVNIYSGNLKYFEKFGQNTILLLIIHPYINNLVYFPVVYLLKGSWLLEIFLVLVVTTMLVNNLNSIKMVLGYIVVNNPWWKVPLIIISSLSVIIFQRLTGWTITKDLKRGRIILLYPGCVVSRMFLYTQTPDKKEVDLLRKYIDRNSVFLDIGANVGSYSVLLSDATKNIFAFEPSPISNDRCRKNLRLNGIKINNVCRVALSDREGKSGFSDNGGTSTTNHLTNGDEAKIDVRTDTLSGWVKKNIKAQQYNLVMKIDVEGNEDLVLKGAARLFKGGKIKFVVMEVLDKNSMVFERIKKYGYKVGLISDNNYYAKKA